VAKPRLRDLQGKPRHAFGQFFGFASKQCEPCTGHSWRISLCQRSWQGMGLFISLVQVRVLHRALLQRGKHFASLFFV
jgi:hypothetical protein